MKINRVSYVNFKCFRCNFFKWIQILYYTAHSYIWKSLLVHHYLNTFKWSSPPLFSQKSNEYAPSHTFKKKKKGKQDTLSCKDHVFFIRKHLQHVNLNQNMGKNHKTSFQLSFLNFFTFLFPCTTPRTILYLYWTKCIYCFHLVYWTILNIIIIPFILMLDVFILLEESEDNGQI